MGTLVLILFSFSVGVYKAEAIREVVPILDPKDHDDQDPLT